MPTYTSPNFNLTCSVWNPGNSPGGGQPADFTLIPCQLYALSRTQGLPGYMLRMPSNIPGFTLSAGTALNQGSGFEISSLPGHWFCTLTRPFVEHSGFPNEYWACMLIETDNTFIVVNNPNVLP